MDGDLSAQTSGRLIKFRLIDHYFSGPIDTHVPKQRGASVVDDVSPQVRRKSDFRFKTWVKNILEAPLPGQHHIHGMVREKEDLVLDNVADYEARAHRHTNSSDDLQIIDRVGPFVVDEGLPASFSDGEDAIQTVADRLNVAMAERESSLASSPIASGGYIPRSGKKKKRRPVDRPRTSTVGPGTAKDIQPDVDIPDIEIGNVAKEKPACPRPSLSGVSSDGDGIEGESDRPLRKGSSSIWNGFTGTKGSGAEKSGRDCSSQEMTEGDIGDGTVEFISRKRSTDESGARNFTPLESTEPCPFERKDSDASGKSLGEEEGIAPEGLQRLHKIHTAPMEHKTPTLEVKSTERRPSDIGEKKERRRKNTDRDGAEDVGRRRKNTRTKLDEIKTNSAPDATEDAKSKKEAVEAELVDQYPEIQKDRVKKKKKKVEKDLVDNFEIHRNSLRKAEAREMQRQLKKMRQAEKEAAFLAKVGREFGANTRAPAQRTARRPNPAPSSVTNSKDHKRTDSERYMSSVLEAVLKTDAASASKKTRPNVILEERSARPSSPRGATTRVNRSLSPVRPQQKATSQTMDGPRDDVSSKPRHRQQRSRSQVRVPSEEPPGSDSTSRREEFMKKFQANIDPFEEAKRRRESAARENAMEEQRAAERRKEEERKHAEERRKAQEAQRRQAEETERRQAEWLKFQAEQVVRNQEKQERARANSRQSRAGSTSAGVPPSGVPPTSSSSSAPPPKPAAQSKPSARPPPAQSAPHPPPSQHHPSTSSQQSTTERSTSGRRNTYDSTPTKTSEIPSAGSRPSSASTTAEDPDLARRQKERLDEFRKQQEAAERAEEKRSKKEAKVNARIERWRKGKSELEDYLVTLHDIDWVKKRGFVSSLLTNNGGNVKKAYFEAIRALHPDKLSDATILESGEAAVLFNMLKEAYEKRFK